MLVDWKLVKDDKVGTKDGKTISEETVWLSYRQGDRSDAGEQGSGLPWRPQGTGRPATEPPAECPGGPGKEVLRRRLSAAEWPERGIDQQNEIIWERGLIEEKPPNEPWAMHRMNWQGGKMTWEMKEKQFPGINRVHVRGQSKGASIVRYRKMTEVLETKLKKLLEQEASKFFSVKDQTENNLGFAGCGASVQQLNSAIAAQKQPVHKELSIATCW